MNTQIAEIVRKIRWRVDQELTVRNIEPLFKDNYADKYTKQEFLIDADMEFYKIKKLFEKNPKVLKEDPLLGVDYLKIIQLVKQTKLLENSSDHYSAADQTVSAWNNVDLITHEKERRAQAELDRYNKKMLLEMSEADTSQMSMGDDEVEESAKAIKRKEMKEQQKVIQQFEKLATQFERTQGADASVKTKSKMGDKEVVETAGMLKRKTKLKKEKSLSSKLRMKEKKGK